MNDVRMPIETVREGNKITKSCVENVYKIVNRVIDGMDKSYNKSKEILDSLQDDEYGEKSAVIFGKGSSEPCMTDTFDEEIGNNLAFIKMKLNANIKKRNFLVRIYNNYVDFINQLDREIFKVEDLIELDLLGVRKRNPDYLINSYINEELNQSYVAREIFRTNKLQEKFDELYEVQEETDEPESED